MEPVKFEHYPGGIVVIEDEELGAVDGLPPDVWSQAVIVLTRKGRLLKSRYTDIPEFNYTPLL